MLRRLVTGWIDANPVMVGIAVAVVAALTVIYLVRRR
jgi:hypothetical protein